MLLFASELVLIEVLMEELDMSETDDMVMLLVSQLLTEESWGALAYSLK